MEYDPEFARSFMRRTLDIARSYSGPYDATLLINCLLGLLIVLKEQLLGTIPAVPFDSLVEWGIKPGSIKSTGRSELGHEHSLNLRQLVHRLRNSVAHFRIDPVSHSGEVGGFSFKDMNGFHAEVSLTEIRELVFKLAEHLEKSS